MYMSWPKERVVEVTAGIILTVTHHCLLPSGESVVILVGTVYYNSFSWPPWYAVDIIYYCVLGWRN